MPKSRGSYALVPLSKIVPNPWNPNEQDADTFEEQKNSLRLYQFAAPIIVRETGNKYEIIDGEHRWRAAKEMKMPKLPVWNLGKVSDEEAKLLTEVFIHLHGKPELEKEAKLLLSLHEEHGLPIEKVAASLPMPESVIQSILDSGDYDWGKFDAKGSPRDQSGGSFNYSAAGLTKDQLSLIETAMSTAGGEPCSALAYICQFYLDEESHGEEE